jgi:hypothetical protein
MNVNKITFFVLSGLLYAFLFLVGSIYLVYYNKEISMVKSTFLYYVWTSALQGLGLSLIFYLLDRKRKK